jgi:tRNA threonylcarbamoyl adenosine modification protein YeaZ
LQLKTWTLGRELSSQLHQIVGEFMGAQAWSALDFVAVAIGPGGFTGTRVGVVTARTLGQQLHRPVFGISTLAAIAWQHRQREPQLIAVQSPARRGELFGAIYAVNATGIDGDNSIRDTLYTPDAWTELLATQKPHQIVAVEHPIGASVQQVLELGAIAYQRGDRDTWATVKPFYGQHPVPFPAAVEEKR